MSDETGTEREAHRLYDAEGEPTTDRPWIIRTYSGHSSPRASNELYRSNLAAGQTGLSIAFDLPTQCGYDSDDPIAKPEVGKVGVPITSLDDMHLLFDEIPIEKMNTSMTINGTAMWLLALYVALARERGVDVAELTGTTQNDLVKEYLARGTYIYPPAESMRIIAEMYEYCLEEIPRWNPSNICSYHLQEAAATPTQEVAFALANAISLLDLIKERGHFTDEQFERAVGRISFFVNAGIRFVEETCKMRAFGELWDEYCRERFGVTDPKYRRFRYGVQVNSLGLTETQPENNAWRILIEALGVTLSRDARARAVQLPAWNEALSLPRPWDQQWSLRLQQILAYETDLLEYPDLFEGSVVVESKVAEIKRDAKAEIETILGMGGVIPAIESGYMKGALVRSMSERMTAINSGEQIVVGVNRWTEGLPSPLLQGDDGGVFTLDEAAIAEAIGSLEDVRGRRDQARADAAVEALKAAARDGSSMMEPSIECALARVTTGEWAGALREVFGEYRPSTGVEGQRLGLAGDRVDALRTRVQALADTLGHRPKILVGKPGLDGHSNGAEVIAVSARHVGFDVVYSGIRLSPEDIVQSAVEEGVDLIGASVLSGSHVELAQQIVDGLRAHGAEDTHVVVGGIIPPGDVAKLKGIGVERVYTPADYELIDIMESITDVIEATPASGAA
ncbi:protein meaA [Iamia majanohamensis]|uniref:Protein meaA n=1 Tax=Iamia majanohamensis TaxID=467976 RepID=A0AAE9Y969_9ACTN|nr:protein meaA [Iamia majanohamensis]WCO66853.1 protein meaA [Iamia majanohamensis]